MLQPLMDVRRRSTANAGWAYLMYLEDATEGIVSHVSSSTRGSFSPSGGMVLPRDVALDLWQRMTQLPDAEEMRCHIPRYGLALGRSGEYHWFATICWECNNICISRDAVDSWQTFDAQSAAARNLLSRIRGLLSDPDSGIDV